MKKINVIIPPIPMEIETYELYMNDYIDGFFIDNWKDYKYLISEDSIRHIEYYWTELLSMNDNATDTLEDSEDKEIELNVILKYLKELYKTILKDIILYLRVGYVYKGYISLNSFGRGAIFLIAPLPTIKGNKI